MKIYKLCTGEEVHCYQQSIVVHLGGKRQVLSTGALNGGLRNDITAVFNNDGTVGSGMPIPLLAPTYAGHIAALAEKLGLDSQSATGLVTAAQMENVSIQTVSYKQITVEAMVTAGVEVNGARVGEPAPWDELAESMQIGSLGTINIMLFVNVNLTPDALVRSLVTCTEAKTAALQELLAGSKFSRGLATGSGTDGTIIVANRESSLCLENAGKHCKLGELIGVAVKAGVKEALLKQTGLGPKQQCNVLRRVERFGITAEGLWLEFQQNSGAAGHDKAWFWQRVEEVFDDEDLVARVSLYIHLLDQLNWQLLSESVVCREAAVLLADMLAKASPDVLDEPIEAVDLIQSLARTLVRLLL